MTNQEIQIEALEWKVKIVEHLLVDTQTRLKVLEDVFRVSTWEDRLRALEETVRQLSEIHP